MRNNSRWSEFLRRS